MELRAELRMDALCDAIVAEYGGALDVGTVVGHCMHAQCVLYSRSHDLKCYTRSEPAQPQPAARPSESYTALRRGVAESHLVSACIARRPVLIAQENVHTGEDGDRVAAR